jgi:ribosomal protein L10
MARGALTVKNNPPVRRGFAVKQRVVEALVRQLAHARLVIVIGYFGINGPKALEVRRRVAQLGGRYHVVKNTLARRALVEAGHGALAASLAGPCALVVTAGDPDAVLCGFDDYLEREQPTRTPRKLRQAPNVQRAMGWHPAGYSGVRSNRNQMEIVAVWRDGSMLTDAELDWLLDARGLAGLRAALLGTLWAPVIACARLLGAPPRALLSVLEQRDRTT